MAEATHVWMHNPETDGDWECPADLVELYESRGWEVTEGIGETNAHLYDDPNDPRIQVVSPGAEQGTPANQEQLVDDEDDGQFEVDKTLPHAFVGDDDTECQLCGFDRESTIHDVPDDPGNNNS